MYLCIICILYTYISLEKRLFRKLFVIAIVSPDSRDLFKTNIILFENQISKKKSPIIIQPKKQLNYNILRYLNIKSTCAYIRTFFLKCKSTNRNIIIIFRWRDSSKERAKG